MSWARFDDRYHDNRKVKRAWRAHPRAVGLHAMAVTYCSMHETDGFVDAEWLEDKLPNERERVRCLEVLVSVGLFEVDFDGGYRVHDFLEYNRSKEQRDDLREQKTTRQRKWRETRRETQRSASTDASTGGLVDVGVDTAPAPPPPGPALPPFPPAGGRTRDRISYEGELAEYCAEHFPGVPAGLVAQMADQIRRVGREPTVEALTPLLEQWHPTGPRAA